MKPTGYKKDVNAVAPLSMTEASNTIAEDNDIDRHSRQSFIYNTSLTDMLIYSRSREVSAVSSLSA